MTTAGTASATAERSASDSPAPNAQHREDRDTEPPPSIQHRAPNDDPKGEGGSLLGARSGPADGDAALSDDGDPFALTNITEEARTRAEDYLHHRSTEENGAGLVTSKVVYFAENDAAVVEYTLEHPDGYERRFYGLIGTAPDGHATLETTPSPCGRLLPGLRDLRGTEERYLVFVEIGGGYHCHLASAVHAYRLDQGRWRSENVVPDAPEFPRHVNLDGVPDFPVDLYTYNFGDCTYVACGDYFWRVDVLGYESWDGGKYTTASLYQEYYKSELERALEEARQLGPADAEHCPYDRVRIATEVFSFSILTGKTRRQALSSARPLLVGSNPKKCEEPGPVHTVQQIEHEWIAAEPKLKQAR